MAQFDVHQLVRVPGLIIDCQSDLLDHIDSRFVVPLVPIADLGRPTLRLNPVFEIDGKELVMLTQSAASISCSDLGRVVCSLAAHDHAIIGALDVLLTGV